MCSQDLFFAALGSRPAAVSLLIALRWPDGVTCVHCSSRRVGGHGQYHRDPTLPRFRCKTCQRTFLPITGTPLERSRIPLNAWVMGAWLITLGHSACRVMKETGLRYARAAALFWWMVNAAIGYEADRKLSGVVEADEIYVSSGHKGRPKEAKETGVPRRAGRSRGLRHGPGRGHADKDRPVIFVQLQRGGTVNVEAAGGVDAETVKRLFAEHLERGATVYTDSARCYLVLEEEGYPLEQVNHSQREYAKGDAHEIHENGAEGEIALLKDFLFTYRGVAQENLPSYLKLYQFGRNHRHLPQWQQAVLLLSSLLGNGPAPRCLRPPDWCHRLHHCQVGCYTSTE